MTQTELKALAIGAFFDDVKVQEWRTNFIADLESGYTIVDRRADGYKCCYCDKFLKEPMMMPEHGKIAYPANHRETKTIWLVNKHYDGCRGWD